MTGVQTCALPISANGKLRGEEMDEVYRWLYDNISIFGSEEKQDQAILIIKSGLVDHGVIVDPEINLSATLIRLGKLLV